MRERLRVMEDSAIIDMQYKSSVLDWSRLINNPPVFIFIMLQRGRSVRGRWAGTDAEYWSQFGNILRLLRARAPFCVSVFWHSHITKCTGQSGQRETIPDILTNVVIIIILLLLPSLPALLTTILAIGKFNVGNSIFIFYCSENEFKKSLHPCVWFFMKSDSELF